MHPSQLLGCLVTMQEVRNRVQSELGNYSVLIESGGPVRAGQVLRYMQEGRNCACKEQHIGISVYMYMYTCIYIYILV